MGKHYCYILYNTTNKRSYVGYTSNPFRRLRQHNRIIKGGAKYTQNASGHWEYLAVITSDTLDKQSALSLEWHTKHDKRTIGCMGKLINMMQLIQHHPKFNVHTYDMYISSFLNINIPLTLLCDLIDCHGRVMFHDTLNQLYCL